LCDRIHEACAAYEVYCQQNSECSSNTRSLNRKLLPKNCRFSQTSVLNPQTAHELSPRLGFLSRTLVCTDRLIGGPLTKSLMTKLMSGVSLCTLHCSATLCNALQHAATHYNTLQHTAHIMWTLDVRCNTRQHTARVLKQLSTDFLRMI